MANITAIISDLKEFNGNIQVQVKIVTDTSFSIEKEFNVPTSILGNTSAQLNTTLRNAINTFIQTQGFTLSGGEVIVIVGGVT